MKRKILVIILCAALVLLLAGGTFLYKRLSADYSAEAEAAAVPLSEDAAADFTVLDANGKQVKLSDYFGKPIVVNFWATWCPPCRAELPGFDAAAAEYDGQVQFMMIDLTDGSRETEDIAFTFMEENGYSFPVYFDTELDAAYTYGVYSIPMTLFINADGSIRTSYIGAMQEDVLLDNINSLIKN